MCGRSENVRKCSSELGICVRFPRCFNHTYETGTYALNYLQAMFSFKHTHEGFIIFMRRATVYASFWIAGFAGIFPVAARIKKMVLQVIKEESILYAIAVNAYTAILLMVSVFFLIANNYNAFIYFQF